MSDYDFVEYQDEIPVLTPVQIVGGGIRIEPNENLSLTEPVVTFEAVSIVPQPDGTPGLGLIPILLEIEVWDMLIESLVDNRPEEDNE